jgi:hypothetical protein
MERPPVSKRAMHNVILLHRKVSRSMADRPRTPLHQATATSNHMARPTKGSPPTAHRTHSRRMAHQTRNPATALRPASSRLTDSSMANSMVSRLMVQGRPRPITPDNMEGRLPREDSSQATPASQHIPAANQAIRAVSHHTRVVVMAADTKSPDRGNGKGMYEIGVAAAAGYMMDTFR